MRWRRASASWLAASSASSAHRSISSHATAAATAWRSGPTATAQAVNGLVRATFGDVTLLEGHGGVQSFEVGASFDLAAAFAALEQAKQAGDLHTYSLSQTTLEQVFLNIAAKEREGVQDGAQGGSHDGAGL